MKSKINIEECFNEVKQNGYEVLGTRYEGMHNNTVCNLIVSLMTVDAPHVVLSELLIAICMDKMLIEDMKTMLAIGFEAGRLYGRSELMEELNPK